MFFFECESDCTVRVGWKRRKCVVSCSCYLEKCYFCGLKLYSLSKIA